MSLSPKDKRFAERLESSDVEENWSAARLHAEAWVPLRADSCCLSCTNCDALPRNMMLFRTFTDVRLSEQNQEHYDNFLAYERVIVFLELQPKY